MHINLRVIASMDWVINKFKYEDSSVIPPDILL